MSFGTYPFGQPVLPMKASASNAKRVFVLGAYPSALHVAWTSLDGSQTIRALPVDNEPEPFWTGADESERIEKWKTAVEFDEGNDGRVRAVNSLNGSSGVALDGSYLGPLAIEREEAWATDALPTYFASEGVQAAIADRFVPAMKSARPLPNLLAHPNEAKIVELATDRLEALREELATAVPEMVITLGNAAARVFQLILNVNDGPVPLVKSNYGTAVRVAPNMEWYPVAHPGATRAGRPWHDTHRAWIASLEGG